MINGNKFFSSQHCSCTKWVFQMSGPVVYTKFYGDWLKVSPLGIWFPKFVNLVTVHPDVDSNVAYV